MFLMLLTLNPKPIYPSADLLSFWICHLCPSQQTKDNIYSRQTSAPRSVFSLFFSQLNSSQCTLFDHNPVNNPESGWQSCVVRPGRWLLLLENSVISFPPVHPHSKASLIVKKLQLTQPDLTGSHPHSSVSTLRERFLFLGTS